MISLLKERILRYWRKKTSTTMFFAFAQEQVIKLKANGKEKTAKKYTVALCQFSMYREGVDIPLKQVTAQELKLFEAHLIRKGVVMNTVSFYMRILRAIYNRAIDEGIILPQNPFRQVYTGVAKTMKRAVGENVISDLQNMPLKPILAQARDMFLFSFYTRGMAFIDMAHLKKSNITNGVLTYKRSKTGQEISIRIEPCMAEIIRRYANEIKNTEWLLPILYRDNQPTTYESAIRNQNQRLSLISKQLKLQKSLTTYVSRHSWASIARNKGISLSVISEGMGHTSEQTTRIYLASLDQNILDKANRRVIMGGTRKKR